LAGAETETPAKARVPELRARMRRANLDTENISDRWVQRGYYRV
jgi:hypothetical protein